VVTPQVEKAALAQVFWESLSPTTRALLEELTEAETWEELARKWGYANHTGARRFAQLQLRRRLEQEGALRWLLLIMGVDDE